MESRSRASPEQFAVLLEFMESHDDISRPQQGPQARIKADRLWQELVDLLNSIGGGVLKSVEKWKKVWADWKAKTKKKALAIRRQASGTGGGPSSRQTLTASEERVLGIMGLTAVVGQAGVEERGFNAPPSERNSPPPTRQSVDEMMLDLTPSFSIQGATTSTAAPTLPPPVLTPPPGPASAPMPSATSPIASTSAPQRRQWRHPSPAASPSTSTPRRRGPHRTRTRRIQTPFERSTSEFVTVEHRRLQLDEDRSKRDHEREMETLRLESRRMEREDSNMIIFNRLSDAIENLIQILPQLIPSSLPSTDIIP